MKRKQLIWLTGIFVCLVIINYVGRKKLPHAYAEILSYNQFYYQDETTRITRIYSSPEDSLTFEFGGSDIKDTNLFELFLDSTLFAKETSRYLTIMPAMGRKSYTLQINSRKPYRINIDFTPIKIYRNAGNSSELQFEVTSQDLLISNLRLHKRDIWNTAPYSIGKIQDKTQAKQYLYDSMKIASTDNTVSKVVKIASYLLKATQNRIGIPSDYLTGLNPIQQLEEIRAGHSKLWCGNYADIFAFFSSEAGIVGRYVGCGDQSGGVGSGAHAFNEVFIPEKNCWAYVDLTSGNVLVKINDQFLNTLEVYSLMKFRTEIPKDIQAFHFDGDSMQLRSFNEVCDLNRYYFHPGAKFVYTYPDFLIRSVPGNIFERALKFFYTKPYYAVYSDNIPATNFQLYFRLVCNYLLGASAVALILLIGKKIIFRFRQ